MEEHTISIIEPEQRHGPDQCCQTSQSMSEFMQVIFMMSEEFGSFSLSNIFSFENTVFLGELLQNKMI